MQTELFPSNAQQPLIMMSLHPHAYDAFLKGDKKFEFRKLPFIKTSFDCFIYVTKPVGSICAYAHFDTPILGDADALANLANDDTDAFQKWLPDQQIAAAYPLKSLIELIPSSLSILKNDFPDFHPPQKFIYLERKADLKKYLLEKIPRQN